MKRVVLVDDHVSIREMLAVLLRRETGYEVVGEAKTGVEALEVCVAACPQMVITDLLLPELSGSELTRRLRVKLPQARVLVYSGCHDRSRLAQVLDAKPHGLVQKSDPLGTVREAIRIVSSGGSYFNPFATEVLHAQRSRETAGELSAREIEVLQMVAESLSTKEIAVRLNIAPKTVENHRQHIMEKLQLHDVAALTRYAVRHGLIDPSR